VLRRSRVQSRRARLSESPDHGSVTTRTRYSLRRSSASSPSIAMLAL
jgi:hypothetical protein